MPECRCRSCGRHFFGWGVFLICNLCGGKLEPVDETAEERIEGIENDIAGLKLQNKINEYKEKYPEHFKGQ